MTTLRATWLCAVLLGGCANVFNLEPVEEHRECFGLNGELGSGLFQACVPSLALPDQLSPAGEIDTAAERTCTSIVMQRDGSEVCIIGARNIHLQFDVPAVGPRPLVLVALDTLRLTATLDASRGTADGVADHASCLTANGGVDSNGGGAGGAGGGFGGDGGRGGEASGAIGGSPSEGTMATVVRGGCDGGHGGDGSGGAVGGDNGTGGGGLYLIAGIEIIVRGRINASGGGGGGGAKDSSGRPAGGGGGGSGGLIGLDAPRIVIESSAVLVANGGGGGGGGTSTTSGTNGAGSDLGTPPPFTALGGDGSSMGGNGGARDTSATAGADGSAGAGGGGGAGHVLLIGGDIVVDPEATITP